MSSKNICKIFIYINKFIKLINLLEFILNIKID